MPDSHFTSTPTNNMNTIETHLGLTGVRVPVSSQNQPAMRLGTWLFLPSPGLVVEASRIRRHAAFRHEAPVVEEFYRTGGEAAYYSETKRRVLTVRQYHALLRQRPEALREGWRIRQRDVATFARGAVGGPQHCALSLHGWHRILRDTESRAVSMGQRPPVSARGPAVDFCSHGTRGCAAPWRNS